MKLQLPKDENLRLAAVCLLAAAGLKIVEFLLPFVAGGCALAATAFLLTFLASKFNPSKNQ